MTEQRDTYLKQLCEAVCKGVWHPPTSTLLISANDAELNAICKNLSIPIVLNSAMLEDLENQGMTEVTVDVLPMPLVEDQAVPKNQAYLPGLHEHYVPDLYAADQSDEAEA